MDELEIDRETMGSGHYTEWSKQTFSRDDYDHSLLWIDENGIPSGQTS